MQIEKKKILKVKIKNKDINNINKLLKFSDTMNNLYFDILNQTTESLWWHCTSIILQYLHLILFTFNQNVSFNINYLNNLV